MFSASLLGKQHFGLDSMATEQARSAGHIEISYKGIRKRKWGRWVAEISDGKRSGKRLRISLGSYFTPEAAARAYDAALFMVRGPSVSTFNFSDSRLNGNVWNLVHTDHPSPDSVRRAAMEVGSIFDIVPEHYHQNLDVGRDMEGGESVHDGQPESVPVGVDSVEVEEGTYDHMDVVENVHHGQRCKVSTCFSRADIAGGDHLHRR